MHPLGILHINLSNILKNSTLDKKQFIFTFKNGLL